MSTDPDRIERRILLSAPLERVWQALADAEAFGHWFGMAFDGPFVAGETITGRIAPTRVDPEVARLQAPHVGTPFELHIERIEPMRVFAYRWHPFAIDPEVDYRLEPTTLVTFELEPVEGGTLLRLTESGFAALPQARRAAALQANQGGWAAQMGNIEKYVARH